MGEPKPPAAPSATGITLNANVYSSVDGPTDYWFVYGAPGDHASWQETTHGTVQIADRDPHPVSQAVTGLQADTVYNWQVCVADQEESPVWRDTTIDRVRRVGPKRLGPAGQLALREPERGQAVAETGSG